VISLKEVYVEIIGPEPPCVRCQAVRKIVETAAEKLKSSGVSVKIEKLNITSGKVARKYGVLSSPALAINGVVKLQGVVPSEEEVEKLLREAAQ
jgi:protein-disulfide isomerase